MQTKPSRRRDIQLDYIKTRLNQHQCVSCGTPHNLTKDHIIPIGFNGLDGMANYQILCKPCNELKGCDIRHESVEVIEMRELIPYFLFKTRISGLSKGYLHNILSCAYGVGNIMDYKDDHVVKLSSIKRLKEFALAYNVESILLCDFRGKVKKVPIKSSYLLGYNPRFNLNKYFIDQMVSKIASSVDDYYQVA